MKISMTNTTVRSPTAGLGAVFFEMLDLFLALSYRLVRLM